MSHTGRNLALLPAPCRVAHTRYEEEEFSPFQASGRRGAADKCLDLPFHPGLVGQYGCTEPRGGRSEAAILFVRMRWKFRSCRLLYVRMITCFFLPLRLLGEGCFEKRAIAFREARDWDREMSLSSI